MEDCPGGTPHLGGAALAPSPAWPQCASPCARAPPALRDTHVTSCLLLCPRPVVMVPMGGTPPPGLLRTVPTREARVPALPLLCPGAAELCQEQRDRGYRAELCQPHGHSARCMPGPEASG